MKKIALLLSLLLLVFQVFSQLVNIEKERKALKTGFQGSLSFGFNLIENTSRIIQGGNTTNLQYVTKNKKNSFLILNDYTLMKVIKDNDNYDLINKNFQHFRYNYLLGDTSLSNFGNYTYELFFQRQQNKIKYIQLRLLFGTGPRFRLYHSEKSYFYLSPLVMYENEILSDSAHTITKQIKGDFYVSIGIKINDVFKFTNVTYYQPALLDLGSQKNFERFKDFRLSSETSLTFGIIKNLLQYSVIFNLSYDSRPPEELINKPMFYTFKNQLTIKF